MIRGSLKAVLLVAVSSCFVQSSIAAAEVEPNNLAECIKVLKQTLPPGTITTLKTGQEDAVSELHYSVGAWVRNKWIRGKSNSPLVKSFAKMGLTNPDDISSIIMTSLWRDLHSQPWKVEKQVNAIKEYNFHNAPQVTVRRMIPEKMWTQQVETVDGKKFQLSDYKNKCLVILISFYDSHSIDAINYLKSMKSKFSNKDFAVVAYLFDSNSVQAKKFVEQTKPGFPFIADRNYISKDVQGPLIMPGGMSLPVTIIVGRDGYTITRFNNWDPQFVPLATKEIEKAISKK